MTFLYQTFIMNIERATDRRLARYHEKITANLRQGRLFFCYLVNKSNDSNEHNNKLKQSVICNHAITPFQIGGSTAYRIW